MAGIHLRAVFREYKKYIMSKRNTKPKTPQHSIGMKYLHGSFPLKVGLNRSVPIQPQTLDHIVIDLTGQVDRFASHVTVDLKLGNTTNRIILSRRL